MLSTEALDGRWPEPPPVIEMHLASYKIWRLVSAKRRDPATPRLDSRLAGLIPMATLLDLVCDENPYTTYVKSMGVQDRRSTERHNHNGSILPSTALPSPHLTFFKNNLPPTTLLPPLRPNAPSSTP